MNYAWLEQYVGGAIFAVVGLILIGLAALAEIESFTLFKRLRPITQYVREGLDTHTKVACYIAFLVGLFSGHFWR
jgi:hypothetical protein